MCTGGGEGEKSRLRRSLGGEGSAAETAGAAEAEEAELPELAVVAELTEVEGSMVKYRRPFEVRPTRLYARRSETDRGTYAHISQYATHTHRAYTHTTQHWGASGTHKLGSILSLVSVANKP